MLEDLKQRMKNLNYPGGQTFDVETFELFGEAKKRFELAEKHMPEVLVGGDSFLDIGHAKGLMCFLLKDKYKKLVGYEVAKNTFQFSEDLRAYHNIENIKFVNLGFRDVYIDKSRPFYTKENKMVKNNPLLNRYLKMYTGTFDVVYCGSIHHHFYKNAKLVGADPFLWCKKLIGLANNYIILDGPISPTDGSVKVFEREGSWDRSDFTLENIKKNLLPQFELVRCNPNERNRFTVVFKRVAPNMKYITLKEIMDGALGKVGDSIVCNAARPKNSMFRVGKFRVKLDTGLQSDSIFQILNGIPKFFIPHTYVIVDPVSNKRIGDVAYWADGDELRDKETLYTHYLKMNNELSCLGLVESHFKMPDYKYYRNTLVDVDVDMIRQSGIINKNYRNNWYKTKVEYMPEHKKDFKLLVDHWSDADIYRRLINKNYKCTKTL